MLLKILIVAVALFVAYKLFFNDFKKKRKENEDAEKKDYEKKKAAGELVKDPICGTYIAVDGDSVRVKDGDKIYHFCSYECRDSFLKKLEQGGHELTAEKPAEDSSEKLGNSGE